MTTALRQPEAVQWGEAPCTSTRSDQLQEAIQCGVGLLQDPGQRGSFHRAVCRNRHLKKLLPGPLLQADMTAALANDGPTVSLQSAYDARVGEARYCTHTTSSRTSALSLKARSSSTGSR